jgi:tripartite-type tricarboxylate transporter receptor subunit TctC
MTTQKRKRSVFSWWCMAVIGVALTSAASVLAQEYPAKPVRVVAPFPPGGGTDILARMLAQKLSEALGVQFIVDNRGGAGGTIGTDILAKSPPDGYTIGLVSASHAINPGLYPKLPYDTLRDFASITMVAIGPGVLVIHPSVPAKTVKELISLAKRTPTTPLTYASPGSGTPPHLAAELFKTMAGVALVHVPYKGNAQALSDLMAGHVSISFPVVPAVLQHVTGGRLRALAVTSVERSRSLPDVPTISESGLAGYESSSWYALVAPAGVPASIITRLNREAVRILQLPDVREKLLTQGMDPIGSRPEQLTATIRSEMEKAAKIVRLSGARAE